MNGIIYRVINKNNGKSYIGQTKFSLEKRWNEHTYAAFELDFQSRFYVALRKHGKENFEPIVIAQCSSRNEMNELEVFWIAHYRTFEPENGYNATMGGDYVELTPEAREKLVKLTKGENKVPKLLKNA